MSRIDTASTSTSTIRRVAVTAIALTTIAACQDDGPVQPVTLPGSEVIASRPLIDKPQFHFTGILFAGSHDSTSSEIYSVNTDGSGLQRLTNDSLIDVYPDVSPAGPRFAWVRYDDTSAQTSEIYAQNFDGSKRKKLTSLKSVSLSPRYSPDGQKIAFTSLVPGWGAEIFTINADGTGLVRLTFSGKNSGSPSWSPDGSKIAFISAGNNGYHGVWVMDANGSNQKQITTCVAPGCDHPKWNPVTNDIAVERGGSNEIFVVDATTGGTTGYIPSIPGLYDLMPTWSKDGTKIIFSSLRGNNGTYDLFETIPMRRTMTVPPPVVRLTSLPGEEMMAAYSR